MVAAAARPGRRYRRLVSGDSVSAPVRRAAPGNPDADAYLEGIAALYRQAQTARADAAPARSGADRARALPYGRRSGVGAIRATHRHRRRGNAVQTTLFDARHRLRRTGPSASGAEGRRPGAHPLQRQPAAVVVRRNRLSASGAEGRARWRRTLRAVEADWRAARRALVAGAENRRAAEPKSKPNWPALDIEAVECAPEAMPYLEVRVPPRPARTRPARPYRSGAGRQAGAAGAHRCARRQARTARQASAPLSLDDLGQLDPLAIFNSAYAARYGAAPPADLLAAFNEILNLPRTRWQA
jgi:hypothetical protein